MTIKRSAITQGLAAGIIIAVIGAGVSGYSVGYLRYRQLQGPQMTTEISTQNYATTLTQVYPTTCTATITLTTENSCRLRP